MGEDRWEGGKPRAAGAAAIVTILVSILILGGEHVALAQVLLTQQEALRLAFPEPATIERRTAYLSPAQLDSARAWAGPGVAVDASVLSYYVGFREGTPLGVAYFDAHRVRTLPEVVMIVVTPDARVDRIEILKFSEPPEYRLPESWLRQFHGKPLADELALKRAIVNMTGATLSSQAVTSAVRRVLALHRVIRPLEPSARSASETPESRG